MTTKTPATKGIHKGKHRESVALRKGAPSGSGVAKAPVTEPVVSALDDAVATVLARDIYTRERHYFLMRGLIVMTIALMVSVAGNVYQGMRAPIVQNFISDESGRVIELKALNRPVESITFVTNFVTDAITQAYTYSFANYRTELSAAKKNFTPSGWEGFEKALKDSGTLQAVIDNKYVATAVVTGAPVLKNQGIVDGVYAYRFEVPILVTYQSANQRTAQNLMITATVVSQPQTIHPKALGIKSLIAK
ncbi:DotI/IcmL/TraM family protein [Thalassospira xiamenensis]|uniref:Intracellular multiplication protein IcmL n=1 Tax=Thalassospira xiamenensis TaxID=220697 RepID=A0A285TTD6_9PROT|nr:DotI/IcmL/TraM family protein [Thalassospira xiamenensis]SOC27148.1 intracellular multiplication protein IcmL [Thalassospira xiamenensis]